MITLSVTNLNLFVEIIEIIIIAIYQLEIRLAIIMSEVEITAEEGTGEGVGFLRVTQEKVPVDMLS